MLDSDACPSRRPPLYSLSAKRSRTDSVAAGKQSRFWYGIAARLRPDLPRVALLVGLVLTGTLLGLLQVWPLAILVDVVLTPTPREGWIDRWMPAFTSAERGTQILVLAGAAFLLHLLQGVLSMIRLLVHTSLNNRFITRIRCELFAKMQAMHVQYHQAEPLGERMFRLTSDTLGFGTIVEILVNVLIAAATLSIMLAIMVWRSPELTLVSLSIVPLLLIANIAFAGVLKRYSTTARELGSRLSSSVHRAMVSIPLMQLFRRERHEFDRFHGAVCATNEAWFRYRRLMAVYRLATGAITAAGAALILGYGGYLVYRDQFLAGAAGGLTVGDLVVFVAYLGMLYGPLCQISGAPANMRQGLVGAERVFQLLDTPALVEERPDAQPLPCRPRALTLRDVSLAYDPGRPVLQDLNLTIPPGRMVGFVGISGVGKSSLLNLLPRFYDPTDGVVLLDDQELREIQLADLRQHFALVPQDSVLVPGTVAENIAYGRPEAGFHEIVRAAEMARASAFIEDLPGGYDYVVTEGAQNLSGGQRQRIAIARALLTDAPILAFDEPTSALDPQGEAEVVATLRSLKGERTILIVSHRLSTILDCDEICLLENGRIAERGSHRQLVTQQGHYWRMARQQLQLEWPSSQDAAISQGGAGLQGEASDSQLVG